MESENENVNLGKVIDETTYTNRKKHIMIDDTINIDFIANYNMIHEVKKSRKIEEAAVWQVKYYLYYLKKRGVEGLKGRIDYPLIKQNMTVELSDDDEKKLEEVISNIICIASLDLPPKADKKKFCKSCAYYDLCCI